MFRFNGFTQKANNAINLAISAASQLGHTYIGSEHLLYGLQKEGSGVAYHLLFSLGVQREDILSLLIKTIGSGMKTDLSPGDLTPRCKRILEMSILEARVLGHSYVGTEHILMAILKENDSYAVRFLKEIGVDPDRLYKNLIEAMGAEAMEIYGTDRSKKAPTKTAKPQNTKTPNLDKYSKDLTDQAQANQLDPVIGRQEEISRVVQILSRRTKNNPCLIGEAGVGKTAIVEGLAQRIVDGEVPDILREKRLVSLDLTSMVAGTKYRGDFEERIKTVLAEVVAAGNIILFVDEIHNIMGIGAAEGAVDAANILKPQLARGEIQLVGATTLEEYRRHIEKDAALERRFQSILVKEPTEEDAVKILEGLRDRYEAHHKIRISDEAIQAAVTLSARYINDRYLPDKAVDLIDEAASCVKLKAFTAPKDIKELEERLKSLREEKESAINAQEFEQAAKIRDSELEIKDKIQVLDGNWKCGDRQQGEVTAEDVAQVVAKATGIDVTTLTQEQSQRLLHLEEELHRQVVGQDQAVTAVAKAIRRGRVGLKDPGRPIGSFIFLGPTGVGKTELTKALAKALFGSEQALIRLDMSEYMEAHAASKMVGAPPGYVGYDDGGQLTERIRRRPYSVVLFDEIEKAHPDVFNMLLQILEDGTLTDSQGRRVSFQNAVIIMTSNLGARFITERKNFGFSAGGEEDDDKRIRSDVLGELRRAFKPEFLNRVDETIVFHKLTQEEIHTIAQRLLEQVSQRVEQMGIALTFAPQAVEAVAKAGFDPIYGARPLRRAIQQKIEDAFADHLLKGDFAAGDSVLCTLEGEEYRFLKGEKRQ